jgi:periplasmic protein CpxP/Spy
MWTAVLALGTTAVSSVPLMAQDTPAPASQQQDQAGPPRDRRGGPGGEEHQLERLTKKLNLTTDQVTQVKAIEDDSRKQSMAVREDNSIAGPDKRAKMMDIRKASQDKIRALLTDEQKPKYDAMLAEMQQRMQDRKGAPQQ